MRTHRARILAMPSPRYVLKFSCRDRPGIVAAVSTCLFQRSGNIDDSAAVRRYRDGRVLHARGFQQTAPDAGRSRCRADSTPLADRIPHELDAARHVGEAARPASGLEIRPLPERHPLSLAIGELSMDIAAIVANHRGVLPADRSRRLPFHHLPRHAATKAAQEAAMLADHRRDTRRPRRARPLHADSVGELSRRLAGRCINIHHSFLPGFKGAQALPPGVRARREADRRDRALCDDRLDEGPIIEQDVERVTHTTRPTTLGARAATSNAVLARAVRGTSKTASLERQQDGGVPRLSGGFRRPGRSRHAFIRCLHRLERTGIFRRIHDGHHTRPARGR